MLTAEYFMKRFVKLKPNIYSGELRGKLFFLKEIASRLGVGPTFVLVINLLHAKVSNWSFGVVERFLTHRVQCPCCNWTGIRFRSIFFGSYLRSNCGCPCCKSMERHRSYFIHYSGSTECQGLGDLREKLIVYFAPEKSLSSWL